MSTPPLKTTGIVAAVAAMTKQEAKAAGWPEQFWLVARGSPGDLARDERALRERWHSAVERLDALHDEARKIQTVQNERMTAIWLEVARLRKLITEIAETGVKFEA